MTNVYAAVFVISFWLLVVYFSPIVGVSILSNHAGIRAMDSTTPITIFDVLYGIFKEGADPSMGYLAVFILFFNLLTGYLVLAFIRGTG